jgi:hypothetical protein
MARCVFGLCVDSNHYLYQQLTNNALSICSSLLVAHMVGGSQPRRAGQDRVYIVVSLVCQV